jgi:hypothetical protein
VNRNAPKRPDEAQVALIGPRIEPWAFSLGATVMQSQGLLEHRVGRPSPVSKAFGRTLQMGDA